MSVETVTRIAQLNDEFRTAGPAPGWFLTPGIEAKGNDPYGEHDFGSLDMMGERIFWKIDYYDLAFRAGSPAPDDPEVTRRVLTIMLASEY
jgi:hypothetical protein